MQQNGDDPIIQVLYKIIHYHIQKASLISQKSFDVASYLTRIWDAVCAAYTAEDTLFLQLFTDFLQDLGTDGSVKNCIGITLLQQVFLIVDVAEGEMDVCFFGLAW